METTPKKAVRPLEVTTDNQRDELRNMLEDSAQGMMSLAKALGNGPRAMNRRETMLATTAINGSIACCADELQFFAFSNSHDDFDAAVDSIRRLMEMKENL